MLRIVIGALCLGLGGCKAMFASPGLPEDPLFVNRKPLEAHAVMAAPVLLAHSEPTPPLNPYFAENRPALATSPKTVPGTLTGRPAASGNDLRDE